MDYFTENYDRAVIHLRSMSKARKIAFATSVFLCFFVVTLFLIIPCKWSTCSKNFQDNDVKSAVKKETRLEETTARHEKESIENYDDIEKDYMMMLGVKNSEDGDTVESQDEDDYDSDYVFDQDDIEEDDSYDYYHSPRKVIFSRKIWQIPIPDLEAVGPFSFVRREKRFPDIVLVLRQTDFVEKPIPLLHEKNKTSRFKNWQAQYENLVGNGAIVLLDGKIGKPLWFRVTNRLPTAVNCEVLLIGGEYHCLILGDGLFLAVYDTKGKLIWFNHPEIVHYMPTTNDFPVILPDLDGDGVVDLAVTMERENISIYSGLGGNRIIKPYRPASCHQIKRLELIPPLMLRYTCTLANSTNQSQGGISIEDLRRVASNNTLLNVDQPKFRNEKFVNEDYVVEVTHESHNNRCPNWIAKITANSTSNQMPSYHKVLHRHFSTDAVAFHYNSTCYGFVYKTWKLMNRTVTGATIIGNAQLYEIAEEIVVVLIRPNLPFNDIIKEIKMEPKVRIWQMCRKFCQPSCVNSVRSIDIVDLTNFGNVNVISYSVSYERISADEKKQSEDQVTHRLITKVRSFNLYKEIMKSLEKT